MARTKSLPQQCESPALIPWQLVSSSTQLNWKRSAAHGFTKTENIPKMSECPPFCKNAKQGDQAVSLSGDISYILVRNNEVLEDCIPYLA